MKGNEMGMEVLQFQTQASTMEEDHYGSDPRFLEHMRSNAARSMAETVLRTAARYEKIVPKNGEPGHGLTVTHRWRVGIERDMGEVEAREKQMEEARREGMKRAAEIVRAAAARFENVDGHCKWVLMNSLCEAAQEIDRVAQH